MSAKTLTWTIDTCLSCIEEYPAEIYAKVTAEKASDSSHPFIVGSILISQKKCSCDGTASYKYIISYDDAQLADEATLTADDILSVFCKNGLTEWVLSLIDGL